MQYLLMIYGDPERLGARDRRGARRDVRASTRRSRPRRAFSAVPSCAARDTATTVRVRNGETLTTDGPFAEMKESIGGYYLFEADNLDDAIAFAARIPAAGSGAVEVRPLVER